MAYSYDGRTQRISLPRGDTATINITVTGGEIQDGDYVLFRVRNLTKGRWVITKLVTITDGVASIRLASEDTALLSARVKYGWTIGVVTDPEEDENGDPIAMDETDSVLTAFDAFKEFIILETGVLGRD